MSLAYQRLLSRARLERRLAEFRVRLGNDAVARHIVMMSENPHSTPEPAPAKTPRNPEAAPVRPPTVPRESGGPKGPEPTRYGDWEVNGRCSDF